MKSNVPHLGCLPTVRISFLDKDMDSVDITDTSYPKFVKSLKCNIADDPKLQIKVADGASPAIIKPGGCFVHLLQFQLPALANVR